MRLLDEQIGLGAREPGQLNPELELNPESAVQLAGHRHLEVQDAIRGHHSDVTTDRCLNPGAVEIFASNIHWPRNPVDWGSGEGPSRKA